MRDDIEYRVNRTRFARIFGSVGWGGGEQGSEQAADPDSGEDPEW